MIFKPGSELPSPQNLVAVFISGVILYSLVSYFTTDTNLPLGMPLLAALTQIACLLSLGSNRNPYHTFMRVGFHIGVFAFFLSFPILDSSQIGIGISESIKTTIGWALILTVVGFEFAYFTTRFSPRRPDERVTKFTISKQHRRMLLFFLGAGFVAWFATIVDYSISADARLIDVLMTMRGPVEGQREDFDLYLSGPLLVIQRLLGGGVLMAALAASVLLLLNEARSRVLHTICWSVLFFTSAVGFLNGSRTTFFYSFTPLIATSWLLLTRSKRANMRWLWAATAVIMLITVWGAMSAMRGRDIRKFEGGWDALTPTRHVQGAFDVYSQMAIVVQSFPSLYPFERGRSLVPLALGWVPRAVWPTKPFPFGVVMNYINGETLERRSASIAVGLPGEGYGNFALAGCFLWAFLMGFGCRRGDDYIGSFHPEHPLRLHMAAMSAIWMALIVRGGVPEMFYMGLAAILLPWALAYYLFRAEKKVPTYITTWPVYRPELVPTPQTRRSA